jgi:hypothetical protein
MTSLPVHLTHAVISHIAKYCSKAEPKTQSYRDVAREILPRVNSERGRFMNKLVSKRDRSAMEINPMLLNLPL